MVLDSIVREVNPVNDFSRNRFDDMSYLNLLVNEPVKIVGGMAKSVLRGGFIGALAGTIIGAATDNYESGVLAGTIWMAGLDLAQYSSRLVYHNFSRLVNN